MNRLRLDDVALFYEQIGSGPDVILVHGLGANIAFWYFGAMPRLAMHFRTTAFDLRGHGHSEMPSSGYTTAHMAADLYGLLDRLGIYRAHLVGHSFGAAVSLHAALMRPERIKSLTIADGRICALQPTARLGDWPHWKEWAQRREGGEPDLHPDVEIDFRMISLFARHQIAQGRRRGISSLYQPFQIWGSKRMAQRWLTLMSDTTAERDLKSSAGQTPQQIATLAASVNAVYGEYSFCLPTCRWLEQNLRDVSVTIVPEVGHFHPILKPDFFIEQLQCFLFAQENMQTPRIPPLPVRHGVAPC